MANRRLLVLLVQIFEAVLVIALIRGLFALRDPNLPRVPLIVGIAINLCFQWLMITALRRQKTIEKLSPAKQTAISNRQRGVMRVLFVGCSFLFVALTVNVGLFISHMYSIRAFAFVAIVAAAFTFAFLTFRFTQLKRSGGVQ